MYGINKITYLLLLAVLLTRAAGAQTFSYLYIQGDRETPIYVKMEDEMQPRYGKDYCIISQLAPGPVHIQVLFQQNIYPPQKFTIQVPENSYRGFIVTHKGDNFALYDLQQKIYIPAGNSVADDAGVETKSYVTTVSAAPISTTPTQQPVQQPEKENTNIVAVATPKPTLPPSVRKRRAHIDSLVAANNKKPAERNGQPQFIDNMVLSNERTLQNDGSIPKGEVNPPETTTAISNSDCPAPINNDQFEDIYIKMKQHEGGERAKYLMQNSKHCFSCTQVQILAKELDTDPQRYNFLKQVYPHVTDQANFRNMQSLFKSAEWKSYFQLIAQ